MTAEPTFSEKYTDAFWRLALVPLLVAGSAVAVTMRPSAPAIVAVTMLGVVSVLAEVVIWRRLKDRWDQGVPPESIGRLFESRVLGWLFGLLVAFGAVVGKASRMNDSTADKVITVSIVMSIFGVMAAMDLIGHRRSRPR